MQDEELLPAAQQLLKCMVERCCRRRYVKGFFFSFEKLLFLPLQVLPPRLSDAKAVDLGKVSITYRDPKADPGAKRRVSVEASDDGLFDVLSSLWHSTKSISIFQEGTVEEIAKKYFGGRLPETTLPK